MLNTDMHLKYLNTKENKNDKHIISNVDRCGTNAKVLVETTGTNSDVNAIIQYICCLKSESEYPDTDSLVAETYDWLKTQGISCKMPAYYKIEF